MCVVLDGKDVNIFRLDGNNSAEWKRLNNIQERRQLNNITLLERVSYNPHGGTGLFWSHKREHWERGYGSSRVAGFVPENWMRFDPKAWIFWGRGVTVVYWKKKKKKAEGEKVRDLKRLERVWSFHHGLQESKSSEKPQDGWAVLRRTHLKEVMVTRHWQQAAYCGIFSSRHGGSGATRDSRQLVSLWVGFLLRGDEKVRVGEGSLA